MWFRKFKLQLAWCGFLLAFGSTRVFAQELDPSKVVGKYGFDWLNISKSKCEKIEEKLSPAFKCIQPSNGSASGVDVVSQCKLSKKKEFLIFKSLKDCNEERETQLANE